MTERKIVFWSHDREAEFLSFTCQSDAVDDYLDQVHPERPASVKLYGFARMEVEAGGMGDQAVEALVEQLDEDHGGDEQTDITDAMRTAGEAFVAAVLKEYTPWCCDEVVELEVPIPPATDTATADLEPTA